MLLAWLELTKSEFREDEEIMKAAQKAEKVAWLTDRELNLIIAGLSIYNKSLEAVENSETIGAGHNSVTRLRNEIANTLVKLFKAKESQSAE